MELQQTESMLAASVRSTARNIAKREKYGHRQHLVLGMVAGRHSGNSNQVVDGTLT
jgi:hypothetical protein